MTEEGWVWFRNQRFPSPALQTWHHELQNPCLSGLSATLSLGLQVTAKIIILKRAKEKKEVFYLWYVNTPSMEFLIVWKILQKQYSPECDNETHALGEGFLSSSKKMWVWNGEHIRTFNAVCTTDSDTFLKEMTFWKRWHKCHKPFQA